MYKAVIFDLDGTLLDTLLDLKNSVNYALREFGYPERTTDEVRRFIGNGVIKLMKRAAPKGIDEDAFEKCFNCFRTHYLEHMYDNTKPYEGVEEMLSLLRGKGVKTAVVSNKLHSGVVGLCEDFFKGQLTSAYGVSTEDERKPKPKNVFKALSDLGVTADEAVYVGDSEVDVETAKNAGLKCIGVTWGFRSEKELLEAGAEYIAHSAEETAEIVLSF